MPKRVVRLQESTDFGVRVRDLFVVSIDVGRAVVDAGFALIGDDPFEVDRLWRLVVEGSM